VRVQAGLDFFLYFIFFFPGIAALVWYGYEIASDSWRYKEVSFNSPASIQIYFFKSLIPLAGGLLAIQGIAELVRCERDRRPSLRCRHGRDPRDPSGQPISHAAQPES